MRHILTVLKEEPDHCSGDVKKAMIDKMASHDLVECLFAGVSAQVQCHRRIEMCAAAAVSDCDWNEFLHRGTTGK